MAKAGFLLPPSVINVLSGIALLLGLSPQSAMAGCNWGTGAYLGVESATNMTDVTFELATFKMMSYRFWTNDTRFPVGSFMGLHTFTLKGNICFGLPELKGSTVDVVYAPPVGATPYGQGFKMPSTSEGVALAVEFPSASPHPGGLFLGTSVGTITSGGLLLSNGVLPTFPVRLTLIKTAAFTAAPDSGASVIDFPEGIGALKYYATNNSTIVAAVDNRLRMARSLAAATNRGITATAYAPTCSATKIGTVSLAGENAGKTHIKMAAVSSADFSAPGALDKAANTLQFRFYCVGTENTKATISFDATFPFNNGVDGVGMPSAGSDVGIQILLNNVPVRFSQFSSELAWKIKTYREAGRTVSDLRYGAFDPQGLYCLKDCGTDMTNANWVDGGAGDGNNNDLDAPLTFKYYQTSNKRPSPQAFSVPFTVTLNVN